MIVLGEFNSLAETSLIRFKKDASSENVDHQLVLISAFHSTFAKRSKFSVMSFILDPTEVY